MKSLFSREVGLSSVDGAGVDVDADVDWVDDCCCCCCCCWVGCCDCDCCGRGESVIGPKRKRRRGSFWTWKGGGRRSRRKRVHWWRDSSGMESRIEEAMSRARVWREDGFCCCFCCWWVSV